MKKLFNHYLKWSSSSVSSSVAYSSQWILHCLSLQIKSQFIRSHRVPSSWPALSRVDKASHSLPLPHRAPSPCRGLLPDIPNEKEGQNERVNGTAGADERRPSRTEDLGVLSVASRTRKRRKWRTSARERLSSVVLTHRRGIAACAKKPHGKLIIVNADRGRNWCARKKRRWWRRIRSQPRSSRRRPATSLYVRVYTSRNVKSNIRPALLVKMRSFLNVEDAVSVSPVYGMFHFFQLPRETSTEMMIGVWWDTWHDRSRSIIFVKVNESMASNFLSA